MARANHRHELSAPRALALVLALVLGFACVEALTGLAADSLALLADAAHMLSDALALGLALFAAWLAQRPATPQRSFGWRRAEVLAALVNALVLVGIGAAIVWAAVGRLSDPPMVIGGWVLAAGVAGLIVNSRRPVGVDLADPLERDCGHLSSSARKCFSRNVR